MINKSLSQMNAERAAGPARHYEYHPKCYCLRCRASRKLQATSAIKKTQLNNRVKKEREKKI
jgi:hypothetical protein